MPIANRGSFVHPLVADAFTEASWRLREPRSKLLITELETFVKNPEAYRGAAVPASGDRKFHAAIDLSLWAKVELGALALEVPISHVVRIAIARIIRRAGVKVPATK